MKQPHRVTDEVANQQNRGEEQAPPPIAGGLRIRTDLRAGVAWDNLDDQAQQLWGNLTNALNNLTGGTDSNS